MTEPEIYEEITPNELPESETLSEEATQTEPPESPSSPAPKKGRHWPPIIIMILMFAVGLTVYLATAQNTAGKVRDSEMPWFSIEDGTLYFDSDLYNGGSVVHVPAIVAGQKVTALSEDCFAGCGNIIEITFEDGIAQIGSGAFYGCVDLRGIKLPETVISLGSNVFAECYALEAVSIPYALQEAGSDVFYGCDALRHIFYPGTIDEFNALNFGKFSPEINVYAADGTYHQG